MQKNSALSMAICWHGKSKLSRARPRFFGPNFRKNFGFVFWKKVQTMLRFFVGLIWSKNLPKHSWKKQATFDGISCSHQGFDPTFLQYGWIRMLNSPQADVVFSIGRFIGIPSFWAQKFQVLYWLIQSEVLNVEILFPLQDAFLDALAQRSMAVAFSMKPVGLARTVWRGIMFSATFGKCGHWALGIIAMKPQKVLFNKLTIQVFFWFWNWG